MNRLNIFNTISLSFLPKFIILNIIWILLFIHPTGKEPQMCSWVNVNPDVYFYSRCSCRSDCVASWSWKARSKLKSSGRLQNVEDHINFLHWCWKHHVKLYVELIRHVCNTDIGDGEIKSGRGKSTGIWALGECRRYKRGRESESLQDGFIYALIMVGGHHHWNSASQYSRCSSCWSPSRLRQWLLGFCRGHRRWHGRAGVRRLSRQVSFRRCRWGVREMGIPGTCRPAGLQTSDLVLATADAMFQFFAILRQVLSISIIVFCICSILEFPDLTVLSSLLQLPALRIFGEYITIVYFV